MAIPAFIARHLGEQAYRTRIARGLTEAHERAGRRDIELADLRAVVFSDHHRGVGDGADDFRRCEPAYCAALGWYLEQGYELWLLGDVEELWENSPRKVIKHYENVLEATIDGDARGCAVIRLDPVDDGTQVAVVWSLGMVSTPLRIAAIVAYPLMRRGHDRVVEMAVAGFRQQALAGTRDGGPAER